MTLITPERAESKDCLEQIEEFRAIIRELRSDLKEAKEGLIAGEDLTAAGKVKTATGELRRAILQCIETEQRLGELRRQEEGIATGGHAFDLEAIRASIGCKLNRLRCPGDTG